MYIITLLDKTTGKTFQKVFYDEIQKKDFIRKCKYSKKLKVLEILKY